MNDGKFIKNSGSVSQIDYFLTRMTDRATCKYCKSDSRKEFYYTDIGKILILPTGVRRLREN